MFARITTILTVLFFAMLAAASVVRRTDPPPATGDECTAVGGDISCCNSLQEASDPVVTLLAGLLGIVLGPVEGLIGLTCNPISVIGGGNDCSSQTVCCTGNNFSGGLLVVGCSPINLSL
ncbi:hydrophobin [Agaricus bisporus var. bisporus H97]|uniref:hydrophobin n=1 Tax=Agaricus bisporus var. bisporus (strain H97 / ATCC MYA-4626 / FGSC 10389) TaxID=936046 RepID=UPI00029F6E6E|nr:hydrophobin [Agaricus bisporus var. bisporus H97]EKV46315.1 hydrophobin [Agaricus bisporus var. bisporus H97]